MADPRALRVLTVATFVPAFPLCLAHGIVSRTPVPAVGLVPLAFSAGTGLFLLARGRAEADDDAPAIEEGGQQDGDAGEQPQRRIPHPLIVFAVDAILAAALMVVLVFTWISTGGGYRRSTQLAMLASYATIPLLVNFLVHLYLAVREFSRGLALHGLMQWVAWQAVPPDCPNCSHRLRPSALPEMPWLESIPRLSVTLPAFPTLSPPEWKIPEWLRRRPRDEYSSLFVDEENRYQDDPDDAEDGGPSTLVQAPVAEEVRPKDPRTRSAALFGED